MAETSENACPKCGAALPADAPAGVCPQCLLEAGLSSEAQPPPSQPEMQPPSFYDAATMPPAPNETGDPVGGESVSPSKESHAKNWFGAPDPSDLAEFFPQLEILELLGEGGMGAVYKARQRNLDRLVALKILPPKFGRDPTFAERFAREARALAKLNHPNIVTVYDFGQARGLFYFVMEYVDGINLRQSIIASGLSPAEALSIVPQICEALQFAHDEGVVHRDIKPENILLDKRGRVKIADFGLAKLLGQTSAEMRLTVSQQMMGTLHYMAPEQMKNPLAVDHRADIYSLGVVFYELLTGELPLGRFDPPSHKASINAGLDDVVMRALETEPDRRYQQVSEVKTDVETIRQSGAAPSGPGAAAINDSPQTPAPSPRTVTQKGSESDEGTGEYDWARYVLLPGAALSALLVVAPWSRITIEFFKSFGEGLPIGHIETIKVAGYHHSLPIFAALLLVGLFGFTLLTIQGRSTWRGILGVAAGLALGLSAGFVITFAPLTDHPNEYGRLMKLMGQPQKAWFAMSQLEQMDQRGQEIDLRIEPAEGCYVALLLAVGLVVLSVFDLRESLRPHLDERDLTAEELVSQPAAALRQLGWLAPAILVVVFIMAVSRMRMDAAGTVLAASVMAQLFFTVVFMPLILIGASRMKKLSSRRMAVLASVLAMLPIGWTWIFGLPIGVWSLIVLRRREVQEAFAATMESAIWRPDPASAVTGKPLSDREMASAMRQVGGPAVGLFIVALLTVLPIVLAIVLLVIRLLLGASGAEPFVFERF